MSRVDDRPVGPDERACRRVCDGERGREAIAASAATCRANSSIRAVNVKMSSLDEDTRATQGGGMTSAISSPSWATSFKSTCAGLAIMDSIFGSRQFVHKMKRKSDGTDGPGRVQRWRRN